MRATSFVIPLLAAASVSAHGFLASISVNNKDYRGNNPFGNSSPSVIRKISTPDPNYGADNPALSCGPNSARASEVAEANPGDTIAFDWRGADMSKWPHNTGPMLTYLASCGNSCSDFNSADARWFKIQQVGRRNGGTWAQQELMDGGVATITLPKNLAPGNYLIRHEIIALHIALQLRGAEFYPACAQIRVGGDQTGAPEDNELVRLPGAYKDDDPGIHTPDIYNTNSRYVFPGPPIASFVEGGPSTGSGSSGGSSSSSSSSNTSSRAGPNNPAPTSPPTSASTSSAQPKPATTDVYYPNPVQTPLAKRVCRLKQRPMSTLEANTRQFGRLVRRLASPWSR